MPLKQGRILLGGRGRASCVASPSRRHPDALRLSHCSAGRGAARPRRSRCPAERSEAARARPAVRVACRDRSGVLRASRGTCQSRGSFPAAFAIARAPPGSASATPISAAATSASVRPRRSAMPYSVTTMSRRCRGIVTWP